jgi:ribosome recycling factor
MVEETKKAFKQKAKKAMEGYQDQLKQIRTGRASTAVFDKVQVDYYGSMTPVSQVATVSVPEARMIVIQPWDKTLIKAIESAINKADLGFNPSNDGNVIRINVPALTEELRKTYVKDAKNIAEQARVAIRNIRRESNDSLKKALKSSDITEDDEKSGLADIQKLTDDSINEINKILDEKEKEILEI